MMIDQVTQQWHVLLWMMSKVVLLLSMWIQIWCSASVIKDCSVIVEQGLDNLLEVLYSNWLKSLLGFGTQPAPSPFSVPNLWFRGSVLQVLILMCFRSSCQIEFLVHTYNSTSLVLDFSLINTWHTKSANSYSQWNIDSYPTVSIIIHHHVSSHVCQSCWISA